MKLKAIVHEAEEGGYWAEVPALPGCVTQGETLVEVRKNVKEAIALWLEASDTGAKRTRESRILEVAV
jgi:predicted RNase H-like HicB family nuclease